MKPSSRLSLLLRLLLMIPALWLIAWNLTSVSGLTAGSFGLAAGLWLGERLGRSRLRLGWILAMLVLCSFLVTGLGGLWTSTQWISSTLGGVTALQLSEIWNWGLGTLLAVTLLRQFSVRYQSLLLLEMWIPLLAGVSLFSAHRGWNLHRPQDLADWTILQGLEPITVLMGMGAIGAFFLALGLLRLRRSTHLMQGLLLTLLLLLGMYKLFDFLPYSKVMQSSRIRSNHSQTKQTNKKQSNDPPPPRNHMSMRPPPPRKHNRQVPVAIVLFEHDFRPPTKVYYFRQRVMSEYNGVRMIQSRKEFLKRKSTLSFPATDKELKLPKQEGKRKTVRTVISLLTSHKAPFALTNAVSIKGLSNPNPRLFLRRYAVVSRVWEKSINTTFTLGNPNWSAEMKAHYLNAPNDTRYKTLLKETILKPLKKSVLPNNSVLKAYLIKTYLEAHFTYALARNKSKARDQVAEFLFDTKKGYCVHFAHAAVYLMRLAGIPARLAEGYAVPESFRGNGSSLLIRDQEAHAWPEIYVNKLGWIAFDIYPRRALNGQLQPPDPKLRKMMAALARQKPPKLQMKWAAGDQMGDKGDGTGDVGRRVAAVLKDVSRGGGWVLLTLFSLWLLHRFWRRWGFLLLPGAARHRAYNRSLMDRLSEAGLRRRSGETPQAFAERIELPALSVYTALFEGLAHGSQVVTQTELNQRRRTVERQLWSVFPWWKRGLRLLDPFSWSSHIFARWRQTPPGWWMRWQRWRQGVLERLAGWSNRRSQGEEEFSA